MTKQEMIAKELSASGADALFLCTKNSITWISPELCDSEIYYLCTKDKVVGFADIRDIDSLQTVKNIEKVAIKSYKDVMDYINELNLNVLLIDGDLTLSDFETYKPLLTAKSLKIANMKSLRCIKTDEEIKLMQIAADIACDAVAHVKENIKVGMSEQQVADMIKVFMITAGASGLSFPSIVSFGTNTADIHHMPSATKKLESGELIMLDLGCVYKGYCSDITRCFWLGEPAPWMLEMYELVLNAQVGAVALAKNGTKASDIDKYCRTYFDEHKPEWGETFKHGTGHGVGIQIHELPSIRPTSDFAIETNQVHTVEPGVYVKDLGGVRVEDTIVITPNGNIVLTKKAPKELNKK